MRHASSGSAIARLSGSRRSSLPTVSTTWPGAAPGQVVETVGRLDLRDPLNRAIAEPLLAWRMPWPPELAGALRAVLLRTARAGVIERSVYAVEDRSHEWAGALDLGVAVGRGASELAVPPGRTRP